MITQQEAYALSICIEGFLYGFYSGIFAIYLQFPSTKSRTANVVFYVLCLLYVLSAAPFICDSLRIGIRISQGGLSSQPRIESTPLLNRITIAQNTVNACCDFTSQCIIIYRCWIVWGQKLRVVIIPSFLAITVLATWLASYASGESPANYWPITLFITGLATSLAVNTLVTGMIVFRILKVAEFMTSVERTLSSTGGINLWRIMFIIIESGMALFAIQLVRVVLAIIPVPAVQKPSLIAAEDIVVGISQMINGIAPTIILVRVSMKLSFDDEGSFNEAVENLSFINPPTSDSQIGSSSSIPLQEYLK